MELMEMILSDENLEEAIRRVKRNRGEIYTICVIYGKGSGFVHPLPFFELYIQ